jgi:hypothetical protein
MMKNKDVKLLIYKENFDVSSQSVAHLLDKIKQKEIKREKRGESFKNKPFKGFKIVI